MKRVCGGAVENALGHLKTGHHQPLSATVLQDALRQTQNLELILSKTVSKGPPNWTFIDKGKLTEKSSLTKPNAPSPFPEAPPLCTKSLLLMRDTVKWQRPKENTYTGLC